MLSRAWTAFAVLSLAGVARAQQTPRCPDVADAAGLLRCARARSATVVQAEQALKAVQARRITAGFVLPANPTLALEAGHRRLADGSSDLDRGLLLSQTFEIAGQRSLRLDVADAQEAAAQAALAAARREVAARTLRQIDEIWRARATLGFARRERDVARALARVAQARARQGVGAGLEVDLAEAAVVEAGRAERQAESTLREAEAALAARVGQDVKLAPGGPLPRPAPPASALAELEASGLRGSAEVQARRAEAAVARAEVALRRRERVPDVTVGVGVRYEELAHIVGAQLSVPLPIVRRNQGEIAEGEVRAAAADAAGHQAALRVHLAVRAAFDAWQQAHAAAGEVPSDLGARLETDVTALQAAYAHGSLPLTAALTSLRQVFAARRALLGVQVDAAVASVDLAQAAALPITLAGAQP